MEERQPHAPARPGILQRRATRRALLAGTATAAAAGTAAAIVGVAAQGSDTPNKTTIPGVAGDGTQTAVAGATPSATAIATTAMKDPLKRAAHLLRRAGFGGTVAEIEAYSKLSREEAADKLVNFASVDNSALDARIANAQFVLTYGEEGNQRGRLIQDMQRWWLTRMAYTARPLEERMTFIWHGLLTSQITKVGALRARQLLTQNELFRKHAFGKYDDLVQAVSKDPAMMGYLDTLESTKEHPNENYGRELLELFTMGEGNYSEVDVREAARAFTGWRTTTPPRPAGIDTANLTEAEKDALRRKTLANFTPEYMFVARLHDAGQKTFLGKTGTFNGEDIVRVIMEQPATGRFISARLFSEFAYPNPEPAVIDRLAKVWETSGHDTKAIVRAILVSDEFYSEKAYRGKVRSPIEFVVGMVRALEIETTLQGANAATRGRTSNFYAGMDQVLFEPPNVAGWPGGPAWLSSSTFFARVNFMDQFLFQRGKAVAMPSLAAAKSSTELVTSVASRLIDNDLTAAARDSVIAHAETIKDPAERAATVAYLVAGSPEFQLV